MHAEAVEVVAHPFEFDRVLLIKNIDNALLTSFRTYTKENNSISETD